MYDQTPALELPLTDSRFPGLSFAYGRPGAKKTDPDYRDHIVSDDIKFDIFKTPDTSFLQNAEINLLPVTPFTTYTQGVAFLDAEWIGSDGGQARGDISDVLVAIGLKCRGRYHTACNRSKSEKELLQWFYKQLAVLNVHSIAGYASYGFFKDGYDATPVDFGMIYYRSIVHGLACPWKPKTGNFATYKWQNATVDGRPLEMPAWECDSYELIDIYPQIVSYDSLVRKLENYRLKDVVIGFGLRDDRRLEIGHDIHNYYARGETDTISEYLNFDLDDTELLWNFLIPQKYFMKAYMDMSLQRITTTGTGSWWNQYLIKTTSERPQKSTTCGYQGALTFYHAGVFRNCVKFDYSGLYPSVMLTWLITSLKDEEYVSLKTLKFLLNYRKQIKKSEAFKNGCKDAEGQQHTAKILANSLYGLWNTTGLAYNDPYAGAAITAYGRNLARYMISWLHDRGVETVCLDTDGACVRFTKDTYSAEERHQKFTELCNELNATLPGVTYVEYEDQVPLLWIPPNTKDKKANQTLADKLNSIDCYEDVLPDLLNAGLSKNYIYFSKNRDGSFKLNKKGKFKKRDKNWIQSGFVIELITKLFYDGEEVAIAYAAEIRDQIKNGEMPLHRLQKTVLVASNWKEYPKNGFSAGSKPTVHYVWRGETKGVRVIKKVFVPSDNPDEPYAPEYYLDQFDEALASTPIKISTDQLSLIPTLLFNQDRLSCIDTRR